MKAIKCVYVTLNVGITTVLVQPFHSIVLKSGNELSEEGTICSLSPCFISHTLDNILKCVKCSDGPLEQTVTRVYMFKTLIYTVI